MHTVKQRSKFYNHADQVVFQQLTIIEYHTHSYSVYLHICMHTVNPITSNHIQYINLLIYTGVLHIHDWYRTRSLSSRSLAGALTIVGIETPSELEQEAGGPAGLACTREGGAGAVHVACFCFLLAFRLWTAWFFVSVVVLVPIVARSSVYIYKYMYT